MTLQLHAGQEVDVRNHFSQDWDKAKIIKLVGAADLPDCGGVNWYEVAFPDGFCFVFDEEHIRAASP